MICFTICLFISPDIDGYRAPKKMRFHDMICLRFHDMCQNEV